ncbi:MAG: Uma2 family endonuclease [Planctomycetes bacterium]|nr:Uma2 family endonuclease [Planctomycetota bacterium]
MTATEMLAPIRVGPDDNGMPMTPEEFDAIEDWDENYRYELVRGVLIVSPPAGIGEREPNDELGQLLRNYRDTHPTGSVVNGTAFEQTVYTKTGRRRADRVIWTGLGRAPNPRQDSPTIAIEFVSRRSRDWKRDHLEKRDEYAEVNIQEYWVIDRFRRIMTVYRGRDEHAVIAEGESYTTDLLPGFALPLRRLLSAADLYADADE